MKTVLLIGDSIRMGYQDAVRRELAGRAEVRAPEDNGGNSGNVLNHLDAWVISCPPDVLHINCGLHDLRKEYGSTRAAIPPADYEANLRTLFGRLKKETPSKVIWATTTPVNEAWHHATKGFDRFEADVAAYNTIGLKVAREFKLEADDLFSVVMDAGRDKILCPDGVHYTPEGYELLGKAVARRLEKFV